MQELHKRKKSSSSMVVNELKEKKNGRTSKLGEDLVKKVRAYIYMVLVDLVMLSLPELQWQVLLIL